MKQVLVTLAFATAAAIFLVTVPSECSYLPYLAHTFRKHNETAKSAWERQRSDSLHSSNNSIYHRQLPDGDRMKSPIAARKIWKMFLPLAKDPEESLALPERVLGSCGITDGAVAGATRAKKSHRLLYFVRVNRAVAKAEKETLDMDFPFKGQRPDGTINYIEVLDYKPAYAGHTVTIVNGGIGFENVRFHFVTERNLGFNFAIYVYGH